MARSDSAEDLVQTFRHTQVFCDEDTQRSVAWFDVWQLFAPGTVYGRAKKQALQPFRPGEEAAWQRALEELGKDAERLADADLAGLQATLVAIPDITDVLPRLCTPGNLLWPSQLLGLKRFVLTGAELAASLTAQGMAWTPPDLWSALSAPFGGDHTRTFAIDHVAGVEYAQAAQAYTASLGRLASAIRERDAAWQTRTGVRPTRDSLLTLALPEHKGLAHTLKHDPGLLWLRDTPFESVFEVLPTAATAEAQQLVGEAESVLAALEHACMQRLANELHALYPSWREAVEAVAELDVRLAKVRLLQRWQGAVPLRGDALRLVAGVHPLRADTATGRPFVPIHLEPVSGVNVLCGSNMGGKTVAMQTVVLCQLLTQYALPVPAQGFTSGLFAAVRFAAAAETDSHNGLSSFGREVARLTAVWRDLESAESALCCFDEPGRSTNPVEGEALAVGLVRALREDGRHKLCFVATHFTAPVQEQGIATFRVRGLRADALAAVTAEASLTERLAYLEQAMDYRLERLDWADIPREALRIAEWLGIPEEVLVNTRGFLQRGK